MTVQILRARAKTNSQVGRDSVVPFREDLAGLEAKCLKLFGRALYAGRIVAAIQMRGNRQTGLGSGGADEAEDLLVAVEGLPCPVFGDFREKPMLDGVPLGCTGGIVGHGEGEAEGIGELRLEFGFPGATPVAIAAARVTEYQQAAGVGIAAAAFVVPPARKGARGNASLSSTRILRDQGALAVLVISSVSSQSCRGAHSQEPERLLNQGGPFRNPGSCSSSCADRPIMLALTQPSWSKPTGPGYTVPQNRRM
jgi:hypothetical protein